MIVIVSGPVGVGKTTAAHELSEVLEGEGVAHTVVDVDNLAATYPRPYDDPWGQRLALENLADVWRRAKDIGSRVLVLARVVEHERELEAYLEATGEERVELATLVASAATCQERVRARERGSGRAWHVARAAELVAHYERAALPGVRIETDGMEPQEVGRVLFERVVAPALGR